MEKDFWYKLGTMSENEAGRMTRLAELIVNTILDVGVKEGWATCTPSGYVVDEDAYNRRLGGRAAKVDNNVCKIDRVRVFEITFFNFSFGLRFAPFRNRIS